MTPCPWKCHAPFRAPTTRYLIVTLALPVEIIEELGVFLSGFESLVEVFQQGTSENGLPCCVQLFGLGDIICLVVLITIVVRHDDSGAGTGADVAKDGIV